MAVVSGTATGSTAFDDNQVPIGNHADEGSLHIFSDDSLEDENVDPPSMLTIDQTFQQGQPIVWKDMWASLTRIFKADPNKGVGESWNDYIPPYRNLGAIFLKAYNRRMERE